MVEGTIFLLLGGRTGGLPISTQVVGVGRVHDAKGIWAGKFSQTGLPGLRTLAMP